MFQPRNWAFIKLYKTVRLIKAPFWDQNVMTRPLGIVCIQFMKYWISLHYILLANSTLQGSKKQSNHTFIDLWYICCDCLVCICWYSRSMHSYFPIQVDAYHQVSGRWPWQAPSTFKSKSSGSSLEQAHPGDKPKSWRVTCTSSCQQCRCFVQSETPLLLFGDRNSRNSQSKLNLTTYWM